MSKSNNGGARPGAGRKPDPEKRQYRSIRLSAEEEAFARSQGKTLSAGVRACINECRRRQLRRRKPA